MNVRPALLTYETADGTRLAEAVHKSLQPKGPEGSQAYQDQAEWSVRLVGPVGWERDGGGIPPALRKDDLPLGHATDMGDASQALARIGAAVEVWLEARTQNDAALLQRVRAAQVYGKAQELPLDGDPS